MVPSVSENACHMRGTTKPSRPHWTRYKLHVHEVEAGCTRSEVPKILNLHAAQNALDCALWDLEAKLTGTPVWQLAGLDKEPQAIITAYTLSLETPEKMAEAAAKASGRPLLKIKLGGDGDHERLRAIRAAAPDTRLIIDANEAWRPADLDNHLAVCAETAVELVEQPLAAGDDDALTGLGKTDVLICADESAHGKARPAQAGRQIQRNQHQTGQDRRTDRGTGTGASRS